MIIHLTYLTDRLNTRLFLCPCVNLAVPVNHLKMEPNHLLSDELSYELLLRGITPVGTVIEKRALLRECFRKERAGDGVLKSE